MALLPQTPPVNKGLMYINGCGLTYATTTTLSLGVGQARDSTDINDINVTSAVTISTAVNGVNGLDVGTIAASTFYYVYAIGISTQNDTSLLAAASQPTPPIQPPVTVTASTGGFFQPAQGLLSLSSTAPVLPFGYDMFRRVGSVLTDGSAHILEFDQVGRDFIFTTPIATNISAGAATTYTAVVCTNILPPTAIRAFTVVDLTADAGGTRYCGLISGAASATARSSTANFQAVMTAPASTVFDTMLTVPCSGTPATAFYYFVSNASAAAAILVSGYTDNI